MKIEFDNYLDRTTKTDPAPYFTSINKIVLKSGVSSLPDITMYYGSDESLLGLSDINEYGWEFLVNKYKHDDTDVLSLLPFAVKNNIGTSMTDIETIRKSLFPTLANEEVKTGEGEIEYFGTLSVGRQKLLIVRIPAGYSEAELWDTTDIIQRTDYINQETGEVVYSEYERFVEGLPTDDAAASRRAPADWEEEGLKTEVTLLPKIHVLMEADEITCTDLVWFVISTGTTGQSSVSNINLSFLSWEEVKNPHRNLHEYLLRNDDKALIETSTKVVEFDSTLEWYIDRASGTMVGNKKVYNHPLLDQALSLAKENSEWDRNAIYDRTEKATCKGTEYISLIPKNRGNYPLWNPSAWMKADLMASKQDCFGSRRISLKTSGFADNVIGSISPVKVVIPGDVEEGTYKKFTISYKENGILDSTMSGLIKFKDDSGSISDNLLRTREYQAFRYGGRQTEAWIDLHELAQRIDQDNSVTITFSNYTFSVKGIATDEETGEETMLPNKMYPLGSSYKYIESLQSEYIPTIEGIVKNYYSTDDGTFLGSSTLPESKYSLEDGSVYISDTMNIPATITYNITVGRLQYSLLIMEYPGFIVDYIEKKVSVPTSTGTALPSSIKFRPVDGNFEGKVVSVSVNWGDLDKASDWHESALSTESIERMSFTAHGYNQTGQAVDVWSLNLVKDEITEIPKYYEVVIPNVVRNITFKIA